MNSVHMRAGDGKIARKQGLGLEPILFSSIFNWEEAGVCEFNPPARLLKLAVCLCRQLVCKPIVHACGHIFCFWCAYLSVNPATRSECPRCRRPYVHMPRVCKALHLLLQRIEPDEYKVRTKYFEEIEAQSGTFSPSVDDESGTSEAFMECLRNWYLSSNKSMMMSRPSTELFDENGIHTPRSPQLTPSSFLSGNQQEENQVREVLGQEGGESSSPLEYDSKIGASGIRGTSEGSWGSMYVEMLESFKNDIFLPESLASMFAGSVSTRNSGVDGDLTTGSDGEFEDPAEFDELNIMVDLLCPHCDELLYRPIVLNCGHVFCERCIAIPRGSVLKCPSCKRHKPGLLPQVCDKLDAYLGKAFPLEYNEQAIRVPASTQALKPHQFGTRHPDIKRGLDICTRRRQQLVAMSIALVCDWFPVPGLYPQRIVEKIGPLLLRGPLHFGIVCDGCGVVPIIGCRFECLDCTVEFGFDLCESCHYSGFDLTGHVNQEHTSNHRMQVWNNRRKKGVMKQTQIS